MQGPASLISGGKTNYQNKPFEQWHWASQSSGRLWEVSGSRQEIAKPFNIFIRLFNLKWWNSIKMLILTNPFSDSILGSFFFIIDFRFIFARVRSPTPSWKSNAHTAQTASPNMDSLGSTLSPPSRARSRSRSPSAQRKINHNNESAATVSDSRST